MQTAAASASPPGHGRVCINMGKPAWQRIVSPGNAARLHDLYGIPDPLQVDPVADKILLGPASAGVMLTSWGAQPVDAAMLERFPGLRLVIHGAGSIKAIATPEALARGIRFATGAHVNAQPVAEFCLGVILCDLKRVDRFRAHFQQATDLNAAWWGVHEDFDGGYYHRKIGLVGWGAISRYLAKLLLHFDLDVFVCSRHLTEADQAAFRVQPASLEWIMASCDLVSLHSADTPANRHQINAANLSLMKPGCCLLNTARGGVVDEEALVAKLREGQIWAYLDVAQQEPPPAGHPFYALPNCVLTPHLSGSIGTEARRLGDYCLREAANFLAGQPLENEMDLRQLPDRA